MNRWIALASLALMTTLTACGGGDDCDPPPAPPLDVDHQLNGSLPPGAPVYNSPKQQLPGCPIPN